MLGLALCTAVVAVSRRIEAGEVDHHRLWSEEEASEYRAVVDNRGKSTIKKADQPSFAELQGQAEPGSDGKGDGTKGANKVTNSDVERAIAQEYAGRNSMKAQTESEDTPPDEPNAPKAKKEVKIEPPDPAQKPGRVEPTATEGKGKTPSASGSQPGLAAEAAGADAAYHGVPVFLDAAYFGAEPGLCRGRWTAWSECMPQCFQQRQFVHDCGAQNAKREAEKFAKDPKNAKGDADTAVTESGTKINHACPDECGEKYFFPEHGQLDFRQCKFGDCFRINKGMKAGADSSMFYPLETQQVYHSKNWMIAVAQPIAVFTMLIILVVGWLQNFNLAWLPDSGIVYILCILLVVTFKFGLFDGVDFGLYMDDMLGYVVEPTLYLLLLPISIFEGGYSLQRKNFYSQFGYGVAFAIIGTLASAFGLGALIVYTGPDHAGWHPVGSWREALAYSAFIADLDPVATLSAFNKLRVDPLLSTLVGGEATLNDPVAIIMFGILNSKSFGSGVGDDDLINGAMHASSRQAVEDAGDAGGNYGAAVGEGLLLLFLSVVMGVAAGMILTLLQRFSRIRGNLTSESLFAIISAYALFALGEIAKQSGIIVCLFGGLVMGIYSRDNIQDDQQDLVLQSVSSVARLADMFIFMCVGLSTFVIGDGSEAWKAQNGENAWKHSGVLFGMAVMLFCMAVRAAVLLVMVPAVNLVKTRGGTRFENADKITVGQAVMIWHSQQRGGLTLMMALMLDPSWCKNSALLIDSTLVVIIGFTFLIGFTCPLMLKLCNVPMNADQSDGTLYVTDTSLHYLDMGSGVLRRVLCHPEACDMVKLHRGKTFQEFHDALTTVRKDAQQPTEVGS